MTTSATLLSTFLLIPSLLLAQPDSFNLASYKLPDIKTHRLDFNLNGNGSSQPHSFSFYGDFRAKYTFFRNKESYQGEQSVDFYTAASTSNDGSTRRRAFNPDLNIKSINRTYFNSGHFLEYDLTADGHQRRNISIYSGNDTSGQRQADLVAEIPVLFGKGRIEPVEDARLAVYILDDLQKAGRLSRMPNQEEILEFAQLISQTKNKRFFDSRLKTIWEIETIDGWLQAKGILSASDAVYFTRLYDNWMYSNGPARESGRRLSAGVIAAINNSGFDFYRSGDDPLPLNGNYSAKAIIRQERANPVNLFWQTGHLFELGGFLGNGFDKNGESIVLHAYRGLSGRVNYSVGWFPNSRTGVKLGGNLESMLFGNPGSDYYIAYYSIIPSVALNLWYYVSPQVRLSLNLSEKFEFYGDWREIPVTPFRQFSSGHQFYQDFNFSIWYSLF